MFIIRLIFVILLTLSLTNALASLPSSSITTTNTEKEDLPYLNDDLEGQNHGEDDEKNHGSCLSDTFGSCIAQNAENESIDSLPSSDEPSSSDHDDENVKDQQGGRGDIEVVIAYLDVLENVEIEYKSYINVGHVMVMPAIAVTPTSVSPNIFQFVDYYSSSCLEEVEEQQKYNKRGEENATNESIGEDYNSDDLDSEIIESQQISRRLRIGVGFRGRSSRCNVCARYCEN
ncbi:18399_t:CDS:2 [Entrophospora sp. SA101]|nr:18399_t:CDS:2 [Entrophospora sp. SA101]